MVYFFNQRASLGEIIDGRLLTINNVDSRQSPDLVIAVMSLCARPATLGGLESREKGWLSMAIGVYFAPAAMSAAQYDECIKLLKKAGAGNPTGRSYHAAFGPKDKLMVFDVWTSQAAFDKFGKTLMPILQSLGIDSTPPQIMPMHKVILPGARRSAPARKNTPSTKAKAAKGQKKSKGTKAARRR